MGTLQLDRVKELAGEGRAWAEVEQLKNPDLYYSDLCGLCAKASVKVHQLLTTHSFPAKLVVNHKHCFVKYDEFVVDVTATQYGLEKIFIENHFQTLKRPNGHYWQVGEIFDKAEELVIHQKQAFWPESQIGVIK